MISGILYITVPAGVALSVLPNVIATEGDKPFPIYQQRILIFLKTLILYVTVGTVLLYFESLFVGTVFLYIDL